MKMFPLAVAFEAFEDPREKHDNPSEQAVRESMVYDFIKNEEKATDRKEVLAETGANKPFPGARPASQSPARQILVHVSWGRYFILDIGIDV